MIARLLNTARYADKADRRRLWVEIGHPIIIGPHQTLRLLEHQQDGERETVIRIDVPGGLSFECALTADFCLNASDWCRLLIIPRAVEEGCGRARRLLMEFVRISDSVCWAV